MECEQLEQHALLLLVGHAAQCPRQRPLVQKLLVSVASRLAYPSLSQYMAYHAATLSYAWLDSGYTVADMLTVQVRPSARRTESMLWCILALMHASCWPQAFACICRACFHCQKRMWAVHNASSWLRGCPILCRLRCICSCRSSSAT